MKKLATICMISFIAVAAKADPISSWIGMPVEELIKSWGPPTEIHEPWELMQQEELTNAGSGKYLKGTPYAAAEFVGRPSNPDYKDKISTYIFRHPTINGKKIACNFELMIDQEKRLTANVGTSNCPTACRYSRERMNRWLHGEVHDPECEERA